MKEIYLYFLFWKDKKEKSLLIVNCRLIVKVMFENINMEEDENKNLAKREKPK